MKEAISKAPQGRTRRTAAAGRNVLTVVGKEPGYVYRFVNDIDDRIAEFKERGYEPVLRSDKVRVGDRRVDAPSDEGGIIYKSVGKGVKAVLMRQRDEWYDEDQAIKQKHVGALEESSKQQARNGNYGKLETSFK